MIELWLATHNKGKLTEYQTLFAGRPFELHSAAELKTFSTPKEDGKTFEENAAIKAKALAAVKNKAWVFAEDSGLEVDGLGGLPGVHSARYAGNNASDQENRLKLLKMMQLRSPANRAAAFKAVICLVSPAGEKFFFTGELKGQVARKEAGKAGFGYDAVFVPEGQEKTLAELGVAYKNQTSHRFQAAMKMIEKLSQMIG